MAVISFDTTSGQLIDPADCPESVLDHDTVVPLAFLLETPDFPYNKGDFPKVETADWDHDKSIHIGRMALTALSEEGKFKPLASRHMARLAVLGLLPHRHIHLKYFDTFHAYKEAIGSPIRYDRVAYADWGLPEFMAYSSQIQQELDRLPRLADYEQRFAEGRGPSMKLIEVRTGGIKSLHDKRGYPNTQDWEVDDFVTWGIKVMKANPGKDLDLYMIQVLTERRRGPSNWTIYKKIPGGWTALKEKVFSEGALVIAAEEQDRRRNLEEYRKRWPEYHKLSDEELLNWGGRATLLEALGISDLSSAPAVQLLTCTAQQIIPKLLKLKPQLTAGHIETLAVTLNVFDSIWPAVLDISYLQVDEEDITRVRTELSARKKKYRNSTKSSTD